jgi:hypothetical protein
MSATMQDHKVNIPISRERRAWWRTWNDYPDAMRDAILALFGTAIIVMLGTQTMDIRRPTVAIPSASFFNIGFPPLVHGE